MTLDWTFQTHLLLNRAQTLAQTMKKTGCQTWSGGDGASHQQIPAAVGEAREGGLQGPGHLTVTLAQACTRVCLLHVCGLCRLVFSQHWTKIRPICYLVGVAPVPTRSEPQHNPGLPQFTVFLVISLSCQLDDSCPVNARESLHMTVWTLLFL